MAEESVCRSLESLRPEADISAHYTKGCKYFPCTSRLGNGRLHAFPAGDSTVFSVFFFFLNDMTHFSPLTVVTLLLTPIDKETNIKPF